MNVQKPTTAAQADPASSVPISSPPVRPAPDGLPSLQAGAHLVPEDGACLMEYVSVLAGVRFGDHPACTDPTLAELARRVNDASSDAGRRVLAESAPQLSASPPGRALGTAVVVQAAVLVAHEAAGRPRRLARHLRRSSRHLERVTGNSLISALARSVDPLYRRGPARRRLDAAVSGLRQLTVPERDAALQAALEAAILAASQLERGVPAPTRPADDVCESPHGQSADPPRPR